MKPFYLECEGHEVAAIYEPAADSPKGTAVLLVPPFGWDDQTSYRPRRDWSLALAAGGFGNLRIDFPGTADSSGSPRDEALVDAWVQSVARAVEWLRSTGAARIAVIALGAGGLVTLEAIARGTVVDDLVLWGTPATGRTLIREIRAFGRLEQFQTGEPSEDMPDGELRAGGHVLTRATVAAVTGLDASVQLQRGAPERALILGRDGTGPDEALLAAFRAAGTDVSSDPGRGWGAALERPQSTSPVQVFEIVDAWLSKRAQQPGIFVDPDVRTFAEFGRAQARVRETPIVFEGAGLQLYAIVAEPVDAPVGQGTVILFNAGAIRRIGPNRMWTEAARRWAALGVPVVRVDVEGIGDAAGDGTKYIPSDDAFYTQSLIDQARSVLDLALRHGLPDKFLLAGLCSGGFWAFQIALTDPRVQGVMALNPRLLIFDPLADGRRELRGLRRIATVKGFRNMLLEKHKLARIWRLITYLQKVPARLARPSGRTAADELSDALGLMHRRGQKIDMAFSSDEPLFQELRERHGLATLMNKGMNFHELPYTSHTLKPLRSQRTAHAILDEIVGRTFPFHRS